MQPPVSCGLDTPNTLRGDAPPLQRYAGLLRYHILFFFFQSSFRKLKENTVQANHILPRGGGALYFLASFSSLLTVLWNFDSGEMQPRECKRNVCGISEKNGARTHLYKPIRSDC